MRIKTLFLAAVLFMSVETASAQWDEIFKRLGLDDKAAGLSDKDTIAGLKEALQIGTRNAVDITGQPDGYFENAAIKILMPEKLRRTEKGLRLVGYGPQIDEFVLSMNRAAEKAAPFAREIFLDAIKEMKFDDARKILTGGDTAATEYFQEKTSQRLSEAFRPIVRDSLNEVGATRRYKDLIGRYDRIPFVRSAVFDLDQYVVAGSLEGLFFMLGEEEKKIRTNPAARVTDLLERVFGR